MIVRDKRSKSWNCGFPGLSRVFEHLVMRGRLLLVMDAVAVAHGFKRIWIRRFTRIWIMHAHFRSLKAKTHKRVANTSRAGVLASGSQRHTRSRVLKDPQVRQGHFCDHKL